MKKVFSLIMVLVTLLLVSCNKVDIYELIYEELSISYINIDDNESNVTNNIGLKNSSRLYPKASINWESSNDEALLINGNVGIVTRTEEDMSVTLTLVIDYKDNIREFEYDLTIVALDKETVESLISTINIPKETIENLDLIEGLEDVSIVWESSNLDVITNKGVITRGDEDVSVTLTLTATRDNYILTKHFTVKILAKESFDFDVIFAEINIPTSATNNLALPTEINEAFLSWKSSDVNAITNEGVVTRTTEDVLVTLTVTATLGTEEQSKEFKITVLKTVSAPESTKTPIVDVREMTVGSNVEIHGVATSSMSNGNFSVQDSTGAIPVYFGGGNNSSLKIGTEYIITGKLDQFQGLLQIASPKITEVKTTELPDVLDISEFSLDFEDVILYEAYVVTYRNLEVVGTNDPRNAHELTVKNNDGETGMTRLDLRVNNNNNHLKDVKVGEIIDLENVTVSQYDGKAQFMFTSRSKIVARPKDPNMPQINGAKNLTYVIGVDSEPNYLNGVTASNAKGINYTSNLSVDASKVNLNTPGTYEVVISLVGITNYPNISTTITLRVRNEAKPGDYEGYYESLAGLEGSAFNAELERLIRNTGKATGTTAQVKQVDNFNGTNYNIYTGNGGYGNREHVWPNSKLGNAPKYDLHNLRAAVITVNSTRSNYPFVDGSGGWEKIGSGFYPGDEHIGDVARIVLYISLRYRLNLNLVGNLEMFLRWHELDPVNDFELSRNDKIEGIQYNRNPFIDHPELVDIYFN